MAKGLLTKDDVAESLKPVIYTRMRLGDFDPPEMNPYWTIDKSVVLSPAHRELAVQAASMSFVLLKNLKTYLPIRKRFQHLAVSDPFSLTNFSNMADRCSCENLPSFIHFFVNLLFKFSLSTIVKFQFKKHSKETKGNRDSEWIILLSQSIVNCLEIFHCAG